MEQKPIMLQRGKNKQSRCTCKIKSAPTPELPAWCWRSFDRIQNWLWVTFPQGLNRKPEIKSFMSRDRKRYTKYHMALKGGRTGTCLFQTSSSMEASAFSSGAWVPIPVLLVARLPPPWISKSLKGKSRSSKDFTKVMKSSANETQRKERDGQSQHLRGRRLSKVTCQEAFPEDTEGGRYRVVSVSQTGKVFGEAKYST